MNEQSDRPDDPTDLIEACLNESPLAWETFFEKYGPYILSRIVKELRSRDELEACRDRDIVHDIYLDLYEKLHHGGALAQLKERRALRKWLKVVVLHKINDWQQARYRKKNLARLNSWRNTISLDEPFRDGEGASYHTVISHTDICCEEGDLPATLRCHLDELTEKELWAVRLKYIFYSPLTPEEVRDLAAFTHRDYEETAVMVEGLIEAAMKKQAASDRERELAARLEAIVFDLERRLKGRIESRRIEEAEKTPILQDIEKKRARMLRLIRSAGRELTPPRSDIGRVIDISAVNLGVLFTRLKNKVRRSGESTDAEKTDDTASPHSRPPAKG